MSNSGIVPGWGRRSSASPSRFGIAVKARARQTRLPLPDVRIEILATAGTHIFDEMQDGQNFRYRVINLGGRDRDCILQTLEDCLGSLTFRPASMRCALESQGKTLASAGSLPPKDVGTNDSGRGAHDPSEGVYVVPGNQMEFDTERARVHDRAIGRWENEGGKTTGTHPPQQGTVAGAIGDAEAGNLRVRLIALENLVVALLAGSPESHSQLVREMAEYISPRPGTTPHRMTIEAARNMLALVERASHYKTSKIEGRLPRLLESDARRHQY